MAVWHIKFSEQLWLLNSTNGSGTADRSASGQLTDASVPCFNNNSNNND